MHLTKNEVKYTVVPFMIQFVQIKIYIINLNTSILIIL